MKNQEKFLQSMKRHGRGIATATLLVGTQILPWTATEAEPLALVNLDHNAHSDLSISAPSKQMNLAMLSRVDTTTVNISTYPAKATRTAAVQLFSDMPFYNLQTNTFALTSLPHHVPNYVNQQKPEFAVNDDGSWIMFSW